MEISEKAAGGQSFLLFFFFQALSTGKGADGWGQEALPALKKMVEPAPARKG
ncbi:MAG: hypothetical protein RQ754_03520 [Desulfuromonadales bacterium]|nr:hypothetical protein [Desulfuromonadales bacterium]